MAMTLLTTVNTTSASTYSSFTSNIDNTYKLYVFKFYDVTYTGAAAGAILQFDTGETSSFGGINKFTTYFAARLDEDGSDAGVGYDTGYDVVNTTATYITHTTGGGALSNQDESAGGEVFLFNPSNTTYQKLFFTRVQSCRESGYNGSMESYTAGVISNTTAITAVRFHMHSQTHTGVFKMYGVG